MPNRDRDQEELEGITNADRSEWMRIFDNPLLERAVIAIQSKYGLPVNHEKLFSWLGYFENIEIDKENGELKFGPKSQNRIKLEADIKEISNNFSIPEKWYSSIFRWVTTGNKQPNILSNGLPGFTISKDRKFTIQIDQNTPINNTIVRSCIEIIQRQNDLPPQPVPDSNNPRKLDWRPVWEWSKRHPSISRRELARMLYRSEVAVRRKLEQLDRNFE